MKILSKEFIKKFNGKIINIHPSLLPKYKGLNTHNRAIKNKDKLTGCTVHYVTAKLDSGKVYPTEAKVKISSKRQSYIFSKKSFEAGAQIVPSCY